MGRPTRLCSILVITHEKALGNARFRRSWFLLHTRDLRTDRASGDKPRETLERRLGSTCQDLDRPIRTVADPACHTQAARLVAYIGTESDALDATPDH